MIEILKNFYFQFLAILVKLKNTKELRDLATWSNKGYQMPAPYLVKMRTLERWGGEEVWIETGTYLGDTSIYLSRFAKQVITLEPSNKFFNLASEKLRIYKNIELLYGCSEDLLDQILSNLLRIDLASDLSFWLDGHFSQGETFKGKKDTPILEELDIIKKYLSKIKFLTIFIDDVRLFRTDLEASEQYPDSFKIFDWARANDLYCVIEHDIFIITNRKRH